MVQDGTGWYRIVQHGTEWYKTDKKIDQANREARGNEIRKNDRQGPQKEVHFPSASAEREKKRRRALEKQEGRTTRA